MVNPNEELARPIRRGQILAFLYRNLFSVRLNDGITITAVMPEELFPIYNPNVPLNRINRPSVDVEMRDPPALPRRL